jgi:hypothetical protein
MAVPSFPAFYSTLHEGLVELALLPREPVESVELDFCCGELLGELSAVYSVDLHDIAISALPKFVCVDASVIFDVALPERGTWNQRRREVIVGTMLRHVHVASCCVPVDRRGASIGRLSYSVAPATSGRGVTVSVFLLPGAIEAGYTVLLESVDFAGRPLLDERLPARIPVTCGGMLAPQKVAVPGAHFSRSGYHGPAVSLDGTLFLPKYGEPALLIFAADGSHLPSLPYDSVSISNVVTAAAVSDETNTLFLSDLNGTDSAVVAVDISTRELRWREGNGALYTCAGLAVLPAEGILVVCSNDQRALHAYTISDGVRVATIGTSKYPRFLAADAERADIYASICVNPGHSVWVYGWRDGALLKLGEVDAAGAEPQHRPLAVVPAGRGRRTPHLVVATLERPRLLIFSLPDRALVHEHTFTDGTKVVGLAANPSGSALLVCDGASTPAVHVLSWPLEGMPLLT